MTIRKLPSRPQDGPGTADAYTYAAFSFALNPSASSTG